MEAAGDRTRAPAAVCHRRRVRGQACGPGAAASASQGPAPRPGAHGRERRMRAKIPEKTAEQRGGRGRLFGETRFMVLFSKQLAASNQIMFL